jgi:uncharacterized protein
MGIRQISETSPLRAAAVHGGLSFMAFAAIGAGVAGLIHMTGDPQDASPRVSLALFEAEPQAENIRLKSRFAEQEPLLLKAAAREEFPTIAVQRPMGPPTRAIIAPGEGTAKVLSVADSVAAPGNGSAGPAIVRINGQAVPQGMSLNSVQLGDPAPAAAPELEEAVAETPAETPAEVPELVTPLAPAPIAGLREKVNGRWLPRIAEDGRTPAEAYARPASPDPARPRIALVVGGLGINHRTTMEAIEELPADITLSFAPRTSSAGLDTQYYINKARADGHEVLIEVPMEPYEYGRHAPEPNTLLLEGSAEQNIDALYATLSKASGYIGVVNYQGAKYATGLEAVSPIVEALSERGLMIIEDGSLPNSAFADAARGRDVSYREAASVIDAEVNAGNIAEELARLEVEALANGSALGTGFAFPVTIDTILDWREELDAKGIQLVPASAVIGQARPAPVEAPAPAVIPSDGGKAG